MFRHNTYKIELAIIGEGIYITFKWINYGHFIKSFSHYIDQGTIPEVIYILQMNKNFLGIMSK